MPDDSTFRFLGLPSEIRVDVYKFVFTRTTVDINNRLLDPDELHRIWDRGPDVEPRAQTNLLETCKKIRQEAIVCFQNSIKKLVIGRHGCGCRKCAILLSTSIKVSHQKFLQNVELVELNGYAAWNTLSLQGLALPLLERVTICMRTVLEEYRDSTCYLEDFKSGLHDTEFLRMAKECALRLSPWAEWQELIDWHLSPGSTTQLVLKIDGTSNWAAKPDEFGPVKQYFVVSRMECLSIVELSYFAASRVRCQSRKVLEPQGSRYYVPDLQKSPHNRGRRLDNA